MSKSTLITTLLVIVLVIISLIVWYIKPTKSTSFVCPESDCIDCMPTKYRINSFKDLKLRKINRTQCSQEYLDWARVNCPNLKVTF